MPDEDGFPYAEEIWKKKEPVEPAPSIKIPAIQPMIRLPDGEEVAAELTQEQVKAISLIMSGFSFVLLAINPTIPQGETVPTGADFFTVLHGDDQTLRDAKSHLPDVIDRLFHQKGLF